ncbi:MAG: ferrodoxin oxidoreductase beta subunit [Psychromonas sp.]
MKFFLFICLLASSFLTHASAFDKGNKGVAVKISGASIGREDYTILGVSANYFVIDNLSVAGGYEYWFSGSPDVSKLSAESTYFIPLSEQFRPYLGVLYSHYFISGNTDADTLGYRAGISYLNSPMILSLGIKQEKFLDDRDSFSGTDTTTEFLVGFSF